jgi:hypothetical protein
MFEFAVPPTLFRLLYATHTRGPRDLRYAYPNLSLLEYRQNEGKIQNTRQSMNDVCKNCVIATGGRYSVAHEANIANFELELRKIRFWLQNAQISDVFWLFMTELGGKDKNEVRRFINEEESFAIPFLFENLRMHGHPFSNQID